MWLCGFACAECRAPSAMPLRGCAAARLFRWLRRCSAPFAGMHHVRIWPRPRPASAPAPAPMAVPAPRALAEAQTARAMSNARGGGRRPRQRLNLRPGGDIYRPGLPQREKVAICGSTSFRWLSAFLNRAAPLEIARGKGPFICREPRFLLSCTGGC